MVGIAVTTASMVVMPDLGCSSAASATAPLRLYGRRGQAEPEVPAQAAAVLLGLGVRASTGLSWVDPVIALLLAGWAVREGWEAWNGDDCC